MQAGERELLWDVERARNQIRERDLPRFRVVGCVQRLRGPNFHGLSLSRRPVTHSSRSILRRGSYAFCFVTRLRHEGQGEDRSPNFLPRPRSSVISFFFFKVKTIFNDLSTSEWLQEWFLFKHFGLFCTRVRLTCHVTIIGKSISVKKKIIVRDDEPGESWPPPERKFTMYKWTRKDELIFLRRKKRRFLKLFVQTSQPTIYYIRLFVRNFLQLHIESEGYVNFALCKDLKSRIKEF